MPDFKTTRNIEYVIIKSCDVSLNAVLFEIEYLSHNGTPSQSTTYKHYGANLAVTGGPTNDFGSCAVTAENKYTAWWMLTFPINTIYFTNVKIFYRGNSKYL